MRILIVAVGTRMPRWVVDGFEDYAHRMRRQALIELIEVKPERRAANMSTGQVLAREAQRIEAALPLGCTRIMLDERGRALDSSRFAEQFARWRSRGKDV